MIRACSLAITAVSFWGLIPTQAANSFLSNMNNEGWLERMTWLCSSGGMDGELGIVEDEWAVVSLSIGGRCQNKGLSVNVIWWNRRCRRRAAVVGDAAVVDWLVVAHKSD